MDSNGRSLSIGMQGDDVRTLQDKLIRLGIDLPADERRNAFFGDRTRLAILDLQRTRQLEPTGVVDAYTVRAISSRRGHRDVPIDPVLALGLGVRGPSEFEDLSARLASVLDGRQLTDLTKAEIALLAQAADLDPQLVTRLAASTRLAEETAIPVEILYAWSGLDVAPGLSGLLGQSPDLLRSAINAAVADNLIPPLDPEQVDAALDRLAALARERAVQPSVDGRASLGDLATVALPDSEKRQRLIELALDHRGPRERFWAALRRTRQFTDEDVAHVQLTFELDDLTGGYLPLVRELLRMADDDETLNDPRALARFDEAAWREILGRTGEDGQPIGAPPDVPGDDPAQKVKNYATLLRQTIDDRYPTAVFAHRLEHDDAGDAPFAGEQRADLNRFFRNSPAFDFRDAMLVVYLEQHRDEALRGVSDAKTLEENLRSVERLFKLTPRYEEVGALLAHGLHSAQSIARKGRTTFLKEYAAKLGGEENAEVVYAKAKDSTYLALALFARHSAALNAVEPYVISGEPVSGAVAPLLAPAPAVSATLRTLFGSLDFCGCKHCRSVYGPAAYLVDLLQYLAHRPKKAGKTPQQVLLARRPDIGEIELTCENTNTPVPYVDLVNEVLENAVAPRPASSPYPQTHGTAEELSANPEHANTAAYDVLRDAVYPRQLPLNLWVEEARVYLGHLGVCRHEVMEAFFPGGPDAALADAAIAREFLGLTTTEAGIITGAVTRGPGAASPADRPWDLWGLPKSVTNLADPADPRAPAASGDWDAVLKRVSIFLQQSDLGYRDLLDLLETRFLNPPSGSGARPLNLVSTDPTDPATCNLSKLEIAGLDAAALTKLHRFVRLWRKLGWPARDLDKAIAALKATALDDGLLTRLSHLERLRHDLNVPALTVLSWWANLDTARYTDHAPDDQPAVPSLHERLFQNRAVIKLEPGETDPFVLNAARSELAVVGKLSDHGSALLAALGIGADDLALLTSEVLPDDKLNLENLSRLYRHVTLAKALGLSVREFLAVKGLTGIDPFDPTKTEDTLRFVAQVRVIRDSGFGVEELDYLLRHRFRPVSGVAPLDDRTAEVLTNLRTSLQAIRAESVVPPGTTGDAVRAKLAAAGWDAGRTDQLVALLDGSVSFEAPLASLPPSITFPPAALAGRVSYDGAAKKLRFQGVMTRAERTALRALSTGAYRTAVDALFDAARTLIVDQALAMLDGSAVYAAPLASAPAGIANVPKALRGRIAYSSSAKELRFLGEMTDAEKAMLLGLSGGATYQAAVNALAAAPRATIEVEVQQATNADAELAYVTTKLEEHLRLAPSESLVTQHVGEALKLETEHVAHLLLRPVAVPSDTPRRLMTTFRDMPLIGSNGQDAKEPITRAAFPEQFARFTALHKAATVITKLEISPKELTWLHGDGAGAGWLDLAELPGDESAQSPSYLAWKRLVDLAHLRDSFSQGEADLLNLFDGAIAIDPATATTTALNGGKQAFLEGLSRRGTWQVEDIEVLLGRKDAASDRGRLNVTFPTDYRDERMLVRLQSCAELMRRLGASASQLAVWATADLVEGDARAVKNVVKAKYDGAAWLTVAKPLRDQLRERQRVALVSHLVTRDNLPDANQLHERYLIDVEMSPCQMTSRIKQAIGSVQLFVQRCLMNLESEVALTPDDAAEWAWMKNYRVWEANRKVFLYPENWLDPALRDDKSPFFRDLENELLQGDLTADAAERAMRRYLEQLDQVAHLDICGFYHEVERDATGHVTRDILHAVGRTFGLPHLYYYRRRVDGIFWTGWEAVDLDIEGDHLLPVVRNRRLYLVWPIFTERSQPPTADQKRTGADPATSRYLQIAWSEYRNGSWAAKATSATGQVLTSATTPTDRFAFKAFPLEEELVVRAYLTAPPPSAFANMYFSPLQDFSLIGCDGRGMFEPSPADGFPMYLPSGTRSSNMLYAEEPRQDKFQIWRKSYPLLDIEKIVTLRDFKWTIYYTSGASKIVETHPLLRKKPSKFAILTPHQDFSLQIESPFFYRDKTGTFFVQPLPDAKLFDDLEEIATDLNYPYALTKLPEITKKRFRFQAFYHPYACGFIDQLNRYGVEAFLAGRAPAKFNRQREGVDFFAKDYDPFVGIRPPYPRDEVDFSEGGAYSPYNWELFFHASFLIADRLSQNQRFEEAQRWFHHIFDPTATDSPVNPTNPGPERFWKVKPFYERALSQPIISIQELMRDAMALKDQVALWRIHPFQPHVIARLRTAAYQKAVVMKYLDNLIAWGDQLFRQDTIEAINEATQLYILAAEILGKRPEHIPPRAEPKVMTYKSIEPDLDDFSNALVQIENYVPPSIAPVPSSTGASGSASSLPPMPYFGIPANDKLLEYWERVGDRLFKIRHCLNIEGVARALPLFEPPINPALLVQAAAAGVDLGSVLREVDAALPSYRFAVMAQKATELCAEVTALGAALLASCEKRDAEGLALLRSGHESALLKAVRDVKERQIDEATEARDGLIRTKEVVAIRGDYYANAAFMNTWEMVHLTLTGATLISQLVGALLEATATGTHTLPTFTVGAAGVSSPVFLASWGGENVGDSAGAAARTIQALGGILSTSAGMSATMGGYWRRWDEWQLQAKLAETELKQLDKQIAAAEIRLAIAERELQNHDLQAHQANAVDAYLRDKYTNQELYDWMVSQISAIYFQSYQLAYDVAKRAEQAYRFELGIDEARFVQFGHWDSLKKGLLAGERLHHDLKRMEVAYLEQHQREYELTKHVSLALLDPVALLNLKETGVCFVTLAESQFDRDYPGHYMRRLKSVGVTIPSVTGPYTGVNCTLTLLRGRVRKSASLAGGYQWTGDGDGRFTTSNGAVQSIATSHAQNDDGLFEPNLHDDRRLPFEGRGAESEWRIELPQEFNQFDLDTVSDVILHMRYTAREGGRTLRDAAAEALRAQTPRTGVRLFSAKREFPTEWYRFLQPPDDQAFQELELDLTERFPFPFNGKTVAIDEVLVYLRFKIEDQAENYKKGPSPLKLVLRPPTAAGVDIELKLPGALPPLPSGTHRFASAPTRLRSWSLRADDAAIEKMHKSLRKAVKVNGKTHYRLDTDAVDDIGIVCSFSAS
jgi:hypothetical protein